MRLNVIHRADPGPDALEALQFQLGEAERFKLKATVLVSYGAFFDGSTLAYLRGLGRSENVELGIHTHGLACADYQERFHTRESAFYYLSRKRKAGVLKRLVELFHETFGVEPCVLGAYLLDAWTQNHIQAAHPNVEVVISSCFEEGVKMYHGNNHAWYLFCDGGPWGPFYPSKQSALCPARDEKEWNGLVALPHLNRDMLMALTSRDDYFSSHPVNLFRARINEGSDCPYLYRFIDEWSRQTEVNGYAYYSFFVSSPWLVDGHWAVEDVAEARTLYTSALSYLRTRVDAGLAVSESVLETGREFKKRKRVGDHDQCHWQDQLRQSGRELWWHATSEYRATIDLNAGSSIVDLRPWCGRQNLDLGPDENARWNGNYPFVVSSELRGGQKRCSQSCYLQVGEHRIALIETGFKIASSGEGFFESDEREVEIGDTVVVVRSRFEFANDGCICVQRVLVESNSDLPIRVTETFRGCVGQTEYPEDLSGILLRLKSKDGVEVDELSFAYESRRLESVGIGEAEACIPSLSTLIRLESIDERSTLEVQEGVMFDPFFELSVTKEVNPGESLKTCLRIAKLES